MYWSIRTYNPADKNLILQLFEQVFQVKRTDQQWDWLYRENPAGQDHIAVAVDPQGDLIGHVSSIPILVKYYNQQVIFGQGVDFMIRSDYRGVRQGHYLFLDLLEFYFDNFFYCFYQIRITLISLTF